MENCAGSAGAARLSSPKSSPYHCLLASICERCGLDDLTIEKPTASPVCNVTDFLPRILEKAKLAAHESNFFSYSSISQQVVLLFKDSTERGHFTQLGPP